MRENHQAKARRYLAEGRVVIGRVSDKEVRATVRGDGALWTVVFTRGGWRCDCPALTQACSHVFAVGLVTAPIGSLRRSLLRDTG